MNLKPFIEAEGQDYVDRAVPLEQSTKAYPIYPKPAAAVVGALFGAPKLPIQISIERTRLKWVKP